MRPSEIKAEQLYRDDAGNQRRVLRVGRCGRGYNDDVEFEVVSLVDTAADGPDVGAKEIVRVAVFAGWATARVGDELPPSSTSRAAVDGALFIEGDAVEWVSSENGRTSRKRGVVLAIVPPETSPAVVLGVAAIDDYRKAVVRFEDGTRPEISYLVSIAYATRARARLYWPRTSGLVLVETTAKREEAPEQNAAAASTEAPATRYIGRANGRGAVHVDDGQQRAACNSYVTIASDEDASLSRKAWIRVDRPELEEGICQNCRLAVAEALAAAPATLDTGHARNYVNGEAEKPVHRTYRPSVDALARTVCGDVIVRETLERVTIGMHFCSAPLRPSTACENCEALAYADPILTLYAQLCGLTVTQALERRRRQVFEVGTLPRGLRAVPTDSQGLHHTL